MDPNATLARIAAALLDQDLVEVSEARRDLLTWLTHGGFAPDWSAHPEAIRYFQSKRFQKTPGVQS